MFELQLRNHLVTPIHQYVYWINNSHLDPWVKHYFLGSKNEEEWFELTRKLFIYLFSCCQKEEEILSIIKKNFLPIVCCWWLTVPRVRDLLHSLMCTLSSGLAWVCHTYTNTTIFFYVAYIIGYLWTNIFYLYQMLLCIVYKLSKLKHSIAIF